MANVGDARKRKETGPSRRSKRVRVALPESNVILGGEQGIHSEADQHVDLDIGSEEIHLVSPRAVPRGEGSSRQTDQDTHAHAFGELLRGFPKPAVTVGRGMHAPEEPIFRPDWYVRPNDTGLGEHRVMAQILDNCLPTRDREYLRGMPTEQLHVAAQCAEYYVSLILAFPSRSLIFINKSFQTITPSFLPFL